MLLSLSRAMKCQVCLGIRMFKAPPPDDSDVRPNGESLSQREEGKGA